MRRENRKEKFYRVGEQEEEEEKKEEKKRFEVSR